MELIDNLFDYQRRGVEKMQQRNGNCGAFAEMRTGKSRTVLYYALAEGSERILIVTPLSGMDIWEREARAIGYDGPVVQLPTGSDKEKAEVIGWTKKGIVIINYDSLSGRSEPVKPGSVGRKKQKPNLVQQAIMKWKPQTVVLDEAQAIKNRASKRSHFCHTLGMQPWVKHRIPVTGTPITNSPADVFSIYLFMDPTVFGRSWLNFEDHYIVKEGPWSPHKIKGYKNLDELKRKVEETSFWISKSEAMPFLPPQLSETTHVELSSVTRQHYTDMAKKSVAEVFTGTEMRKVAGTTILARLMKLQELTSGFIMNRLPDGSTEVLDVGDDKLKMCADLVRTARENNERVVIFCRFKRDVARIKETLHIPTEHVLDGSTSHDARRFERDHLAGKIPIALCQLKVASQSLNLVMANIAIYFSLDFSVLNFTQSRDRLHGRGQEKPVTYYYLTARHSVDERVLSDLAADIDIAGQIVDLDYAKSLFVT